MPGMPDLSSTPSPSRGDGPTPAALPGETHAALPDEARAALPGEARAAGPAQAGPVEPRRPAELRARIKTTAEAPRRLLPIRHDSPEAARHDALFRRGRDLARQESWAELARLMRRSDARRDRSEAGIRDADILAAGARSDMIGAARAALARGAAPCAASLAALDRVATRGNWPLAVMGARLHLDLAWLHEGPLPPPALPRRPTAGFTRHVAQARAMLERHAATDAGPALAAARLDLAVCDADPDLAPDAAHGRLRQEVDRLLARDPGNPDVVRSLGRYLLPFWQGRELTAIERAARDLAGPEGDAAGDAVYAWTWLDPLRLLPESAAHCDAARVRRGILAILDRAQGQELANLWAGVCALDMAPGRAPAALPRAARIGRAVLHDTAGEIVGRHLAEIRPGTWLRGIRPALPLRDPPAGAADRAADAARIAMIVKAHLASPTRH